jgi:hypothetical protein
MANYLEDLSGVQNVALANYFEHSSGMLQSFGAAGIALLVLPVLITVLARNVPKTLYTSRRVGLLLDPAELRGSGTGCANIFWPPAR